jgi:hypothetical protein
MVSIMNQHKVTPRGDRIIDPMVALARCSKSERIIIAGSRSIEIMFDLHRRGYVRAAATANCGKPTGQYDVALVDWRRRTFQTLEPTLDWLVPFLASTGALVVWVDSQKPAAHLQLRSALEKRGFVIENSTVRDDGAAVCARRSAERPLSKAA